MVKIEVTGDTPLEVLASLTVFGLHCARDQDVYAAASRILEAEKGQEKAGAISGVSKSNTPTSPSAPAEAKTAAYPIANPNPSADLPTGANAEGPTAAPAPAPAPAPVPASAAPAQMGGQAVSNATSLTAPAPSVTLAQVSKAGADMLSLNPAKMSELMALLQQFGVPAISELKPEQVGAFATALRGLGANI